MPREKDPFRKYVMFLNENNSKWRCNFCGMEHAGGATRIKAHLAGIGRFGIKGCERVDVDVREEAKVVLMAKRVMVSSDQGVSEERIQGNVRAAPTSTSSSPNVEGGTYLQFPQGVPHLALQTWEQMMQEERVVDIANIPLDGATRGVLIPEKVDSSDQGVCEERIQGNVRAAPTSTLHPPNVEGGTNLQFPQGMPKGVPAGASPSQYDRTTVPHSNKPLPSCNEKCGTETSSSSLRESMDIYRLNATHADLQVLEGGPSLSQVQPALVHQSVPHQSIDHEARNVQQNLAASLTALMDMDPCISSSSQAPNNSSSPPQIPPCESGLIGPLSSPELKINKGAPTTSHPNASDNFEGCSTLRRKIKQLYSREADIRDEVQFAASLSLKKLRMDVVNWLVDVEKYRNDFHSIDAAIENCMPPHQQVDILMQKAEDLRRQSLFPKGLFETRDIKFSKFVEEKLVGEAFRRNATKILKYLVGNEISRLGIYGMGGVGKTTIMVHVYNKLLEKAAYDHVLWITVSQDFNAQKLQDEIWGALNLGKLQEKDVRKRAAMLFDRFTERGKSVIILDDVWECFDLKEVGIPVKADGIKLVLTSRSFEICRQMFCQEMIKINPLSQKEAESLFFKELGSEAVIDLETEAVAKSIVKECAGLPLGIIMMARSMRGVTDVFEWKDSLVNLKESDWRQTDMEKVLMRLQFSYYRLRNYNVQQCFLSCALYPEGKLMERFELIEFFIDQGLIDGLSTREKQYDRGLTILNKLENVCLLEDHGRMMKMHDLSRDMALHILSATSIIKAGRGLMRIPPEEYWTDALEKVSLMENEIREIPLNMSPNCPKLSVFLLNRSFSVDVVIPDCFFNRLLGLKVLNLSGCNLRELPNSISDLVNLRALLLRECRELRHIPHLGKLRSLRKLEICDSVHLAALKGLEMLANLRYLDLIGTNIKRLPKGTLGHLLNLQYLRAWAISGKDIIKLEALETLECCFEDVDDFNEFVRFIKHSNPCYYRLNVDQEKSIFHVSVIKYSRPCYYRFNLDLGKSNFHVKVGSDAQFGNLQRIVHIHKCSHAIVSVGGEGTGICILIPPDIQILRGKECEGMTNLSGLVPLENLEELEIERWENLQVLCGGQDEVINIYDSPCPTPTPLVFPSLRVLRISDCPKLKYLFGHGSKFYLQHLQSISIGNCKEMVGITSAAMCPPPHASPAFPSLTKLLVRHCHKMKRVIESEWLPHFPNVRRIIVKHCKNMEEIIRCPPAYLPIEEISLKSLDVRNCYDMRKLFPQELLIHLQNLQSINVRCCKGMVEMISGEGQGQEGSIMTPVNNTPSSFQSSISLRKLKRLKLYNLRQLKSICEVPISCDSIENIVVYKCPELNRIPLQLRLRDIENLPYIQVEDEEKWKTLMWDHPDAQAVLQSHLRFFGSTCVLQGGRSH